jgi:phosphoglycolate phosphatase
MKLVLFDIDGTLVHTAGAGSRAFSLALEEVLGIPDGLREVRLDGQTDSLILRAALDGAGVPALPEPEMLERLSLRYVELLEEELQRPDGGYHVLEGVQDLLEILSADRGYVLGLATGNLEPGAWAKLRPGSLDRFFSFGGFGSDAVERWELIRIAIRRAGDRSGGRRPTEVFVVGDTPHDIRHGRKAGAKVVAVATGSYPREELARHAPDLLVSSFSPIEPVLDFFGGRSECGVQP